MEPCASISINKHFIVMSWEVVKEQTVRAPVMRRRIKILDYQSFTYLQGHQDEEAWLYQDRSHSWVECEDGATLKLREEEYEFLD